MAEQSTVRSVTFDLLRSLGLTTVFGNPGSTEQTFLQEFPGDFSYILALQEASAIAMADAFAQVTRRPALVNLHSSAGVGNALGNLVAACHGNTPLIVTSGQQHRELVIGEPYLGNREATTFPKPWVKWSYEPARAQDVPEAFMRAYALAVQPPAGPVYLSVHMDDWNQPMAGPARVRTVSNRFAPDPERLRLFAGRISASSRPALVFGPEVDRAGAEVFRYYPYVPGDYLPAIDQLLDLVAEGSARTAPEPMARPRLLPQVPNNPLTPPEVYAVLSRVRPPDSVIVNESTSTMAQQIEWLPTVRTGSFFATASGGIGWGVPAAVGVALADRDRGVSRAVIGLIGDGSSQYSVQALWTAAQHKLPIVYVVMRNNEYSILKSFAVLEETPGVPGLDLPGLGLADLARGWGCRAVDVETTGELEQEFKTALDADTTTVIVVRTQPQKAML